MKILVVDDNELNRKAAEAQLVGHELTVVGTYDEGVKALAEYEDGSGRTKHEFDAVLLDLLMPASRYNQGPGLRYAGQEMPVGIFLALLAAKNAAKACKVGILTDQGHHDHPASASFDLLRDFDVRPSRPYPLPVCGSVLLCANWGSGRVLPADLTTFVGWDVKDEEGVVRVKNWAGLLAAFEPKAD